MAITRTATYTHTFPRAELLMMQVRRVLARSSQDSDYVRRILLGVEKRWIAEISVYGLDRTGVCHAELLVRIDWSRFSFHMSAGRDTVQVDAGWEDGVSTEIDLALQTFQRVTSALGLRKVVHSRYAPGVNREMANRELGFVTTNPVQWRSGFRGSTMSIPELDEVAVRVNLAG